MGAPARIAAGLAAAAGTTAAGLALFTALNTRRAERLVPPDGRFVEVEGARLHYVDMGTGPAIVMVHGLGGQLRNFTYALTERLVRDFRVIVVDRPGSGYSTLAPYAGRGLHAQAAILARFIAALNLDRPLLVGHSLGGALALALALDTPERIGGLALLSPLTQPIDVLSPAFKALAIASPFKRRLIGWTLAAPMGRLNAAKTRHVIFGPDPAPHDFEDRGGGALTLRPSAFYAASSEVCHGTHELAAMLRRYPDLQVPLGILYGRGDRILDPELHGTRTAALVPGAELELIEGGHMVPLTAPDRVADWLRAQAARIG